MGKNVSYFKTKTNIKHNWRNIGVSNKPDWGGRSYVGRRIEWGDHFLPNKFIERSFECWANSTKQLLNIGGEHQPPRKAAHSLPKEVGQNIKDKKRDKRVRDRDLSWGGSQEGEVSTQKEILSQASVGRSGISESRITRKTKQNRILAKLWLPVEKWLRCSCLPVGSGDWAEMCRFSG